MSRCNKAYRFVSLVLSRKAGTDIKKVAMVVLSKQSGIGGSERGHKATKHHKDKTKNRKEDKLLSEQVYISHNQPKLDKLALSLPYTELYPDPPPLLVSPPTTTPQAPVPEEELDSG